MKNITKLILITLLIMILSHCSVSQISMNNKEINKISAVAVVPFNVATNIPIEISNEAEEKFKAALIKAKVKVVERRKLGLILKEMELSAALANKSDEILLTGANTLLMGNITQYKEVVRNIEYMGYDKDAMGFDIKEKIDIETGKKVPIPEKLIRDKEHILYFQIQAQLVSVKTSEVILTIENSNSVLTCREKDKRRATLVEFKSYILNNMAEELTESLIKSRN